MVDGHRVTGLTADGVIDEMWCADCGDYVLTGLIRDHDRKLHPKKAARRHYGDVLTAAKHFRGSL